MATRQTRYCDVCETDFTEDNPGWMIMVAPNAPAEMGSVEYDFCSFDCLYSFVVSEEAPTADEQGPGDSADTETPAVPDGTPPPPVQAPRVTEQDPRPAMTLLDAIAMGQKPGFDPLSQRGS